jgi:hypothetical protein
LERKAQRAEGLWSAGAASTSLSQKARGAGISSADNEDIRIFSNSNLNIFNINTSPGRLGLRRRTSAVGAARSARARTAVIKGGSKHHAQKPRFTPKKISVRAATYLAVQRRCELKGWPGRWLDLACLTLILLKVFAWRINRLRVFSRALPRATSRRGLTNGYCRCYGGNCFRIYETFGFSGGIRSLFLQIGNIN